LEVIPAVDILDGEVVRLIKGDPNAKISYRHLGSPVSVAKMWSKEGADRIHIVDLNAALGVGSNLDIINKIVKTVRVPVQVGGGIRTLMTARNLLENGVDRIVIGSMAFRNSEAIKTIIEEYGPERAVVALDHSEGNVLVKGWKEKTGKKVSEAVNHFFRMGVRMFLVTSVSRDGTMVGPDINTLTRLRTLNPNVYIIAAGGIKSLKDIAALGRIGVHGVIVGRALYEGAFTLRDAITVARRKNS